MVLVRAAAPEVSDDITLHVQRSSPGVWCGTRCHWSDAENQVSLESGL